MHFEIEGGREYLEDEASGYEEAIDYHNGDEDEGKDAACPANIPSQGFAALERIGPKLVHEVLKSVVSGVERIRSFGYFLTISDGITVAVTGDRIGVVGILFCGVGESVTITIFGRDGRMNEGSLPYETTEESEEDSGSIAIAVISKHTVRDKERIRSVRLGTEIQLPSALPQ